MTTSPATISIFSALISGLLVYLIKNLADRRKIKYSADGISLIEQPNSIENLAITHGGELVSRLTKSHVWIWNSGGKPIYPDDVVNANPLALSFPGEKILSVNVIHAGPDALNFTATPTGTPEKWNINFSYWGKRTGVVLEIIHTSKKLVPQVSGTVDGLSPIKSLGRIPTGSFLERKRFRYHWASPLAGLVLMIMGICASVALKLNFDIKSVGGLILVAPGEFLLIMSSVEYLTTLFVPKNIRHFKISHEPSHQ